jgi:hypothetical protein
MTPSEKLARTRLAIIEQLHGGRSTVRHERHDEPPEEPSRHLTGADEPSLRRRLGVLSGTAKAWWSDHPVQLVIDLATPSLQAYMRRRPFLVLGVAAGIGATMVATRAWRLISLGTLAVALLKTSRFSGAVLSALSDVQDWRSRRPGENDPQG